MKIDLHIHSTCSDGRMTPDDIFKEAGRRGIGFISITDHDSIDCQESAEILAGQHGIQYLYGLELSVSYSHTGYRNGKQVALDFLAYQYDIHSPPLVKKLEKLREHRTKRAEQILDNINHELKKENKALLTVKDLHALAETVDGAFGRPHIADYLVKKGIASDKQDAFDKYLIKCNVPKMPLSLSEASALIREAGGKLILAHPNHPRGTSLITLTPSMNEQQKIIRDTMLPYIDGIECWHSSHGPQTIDSYLKFANELGLMVTGGSDCHQDPVIMGKMDVPPYVAQQFNL